MEKINLLPKKEVKEVAYKTLHIISMLALIFNMTAIGVFLQPKTTMAAKPCGGGLCPPLILKLDKTDNPDPVYAGENITYTISGSVEGNAIAHNVRLADPIPNNTTYVSHTGPGVYYPGPNAVVWSFGDVKPGTFGSVKLVVKTDPLVPGGTVIHNTAAVDSNETKPVYAKEDTTVLEGECDLRIQKEVEIDEEADKDNASPGDTLKYTLKYKNFGNAICTGSGVIVGDHLDDNLTFVENSREIEIHNDGRNDGYKEISGYNGKDQNRLYNVRTVSPGEYGIITFKATINEEMPCGTTVIPNKGAIWSFENNIIWSNEVNTNVYQRCGSLKVTKNVDSGEATPDQWSFTIEGYGTLSPNPGEDLVIFNDLPIGSYTATESDLENYHQVSTTCENVEVQDNTQSTCEFHNARDTGTLTVIKHVEGGEAVASNWTMNIKQGEIIIETFPGDEQGTTKVLPTDTYTVTESEGSEGYTLSYSGDCDANGNVTIGEGDEKTCTLINTKDNPDVTLTKTITSSNLITGGSIEYELNYENTGNVDLTNVQLVDNYPEIYVTVIDPGTATDDGNKLTWAIGDLTPGASGTRAYTVSINESTPAETDIINTATIYSDQTEPISDNAITQIPKEEPTLPIIDIEKSVSSDTVVAGDNLTYTLEWSVSGDSDATGVVITDPIPENTTFVSANSNGIYNSRTKTVTWNLGTKSPGDSGIVSMIVKTDSDVAEGTLIKNTATIDCEETNPVSDDASSSIVVPKAPVLQITKEVNPDFANPGNIATYKVVITNVGNDKTINVVLEDVLPSDFTFVDGGGTTKTFALGDLKIGDSVTQTYEVKIDDESPAGFYKNMATARADNHGPVSAEAPLEVRLPIVLGEEVTPDLSITKEVNVPYANPGDTIEYTINITNNGNGAATNVVLTDQLPEKFVFLNTKEFTKVWYLGDIQPGETKTITYSVTIDYSATAGIYENLAIVKADNIDEQKAKAPVEIRKVAVLGATLEDTGTSPIDYFYYLLGASILSLGLWIYLRKQREKITK